MAGRARKTSYDSKLGSVQVAKGSGCMCILFLAIRSHPIFHFILASNRDEFYDRWASLALHPPVS